MFPWRNIRWLIKISLISLVILTIIYIFFITDKQDNKSSNHNVGVHSGEILSGLSEDVYSRQKRLTILVPFRDRFDELLEFVPHMSKFLHSQHISYKILVVNQIDHYRFNRAALINVGYLLTKNNSDYIAIHDVDLLPLNPMLSYDYPHAGPHHIASPQYHPIYNYDNYFGGILVIKNLHFELVNGMSNRYFGWGLEDDEFFTRIKDVRLNISRPENLKTNRTNTFHHIHTNRRKRDMSRVGDQRSILRKRDRETGLNNIKFKLIQRHQLNIDRLPCMVANVQLECDKKRTPWCEFPAKLSS